MLIFMIYKYTVISFLKTEPIQDNLNRIINPDSKGKSLYQNVFEQTLRKENELFGNTTLSTIKTSLNPEYEYFTKIENIYLEKPSLMLKTQVDSSKNVKIQGFINIEDDKNQVLCFDKGNIPEKRFIEGKIIIPGNKSRKK